MVDRTGVKLRMIALIALVFGLSRLAVSAETRSAQGSNTVSTITVKRKPYTVKKYRPFPKMRRPPRTLSPRRLPVERKAPPTPLIPAPEVPLA